VSGVGLEGEIRIVELPGHPFFVATLFLPQARSTADRPHPLLAGYAAAVSAAGGPELYYQV
jgi:CTP synthase (UTP-ammonia lyase)